MLGDLKAAEGTIPTYDVGSMPFPGDFKIYLEGLSRFREGRKTVESDFFERSTVKVFLDKLKAGLTIPNYPQFRDMNEMFLEAFEGLVKVGETYVMESPRVKSGFAAIPEVQVLRKHGRELAELSGRDKVRLKVCITGPYTLINFFYEKDAEALLTLGRLLAEIVRENLFKDKFIEVSLLSVDEPLVGCLSEPGLNYGEPGREALIKALGAVCWEASSRGVETALHLHETGNDFFWEIENLDVVEGHVDDHIYRSEAAKRKAERAGKRFKVSIAVTDFDALLTEALKGKLKPGESAEQALGEIWSAIRRGNVNPEGFLEPVEVLEGRLKASLRFLGGLVAYAGPECGLKSFPTYECALECLRRVAEASRTL